MADNLQATPQKRPNIGALAQLLKRIDEFGRKPFGYDNPPVQMLSDLLGVPGTQRTLERLAYGEALTEPRGVLKEDTVDALFNAPGALGKLAGATKGLPIGAVIKPKGGNWLEGSVEGALKGLKPRIRTEGVNGHTAENVATDVAMNNWIEKQLTRYIKNEMATPEDPIRALAERGVLHYAPRSPASGQVERAMERRVQGGFPAGGYGESDPARMYETLADSSIQGHVARDWAQHASPEILSQMPWLKKLSPEVQIFEKTNPSIARDLGFTHLIDELRNATNPASGLPPELLLKYSSLPQVSVPQAVERVAKINEWRAVQKAEADLARANNAATVLHKEYPEAGFRWVELKAPEALPEGWSEAMKSKKTGRANMWYDENKVIQDKHPGEQALADALKYEGDTMGHCVGGYCPDVMEGRSRIYSLRDAKGQPHVTIEAKPPNKEYVDTDEVVQRFWETHGRDPVNKQELMNFEGLVPRIIQIKGKANRAPNPEYLPFVQDFVRSGKWSDVGDLQNTGLRRVADVFNPMELQTLEQRHGVNPASITDYMTPEEIAQYQSLFTQGR